MTKAGYKMTEIGEIPESWEIQELVNYSMSRDSPIQTGPFGAQLHSADYVKNNGVPLILIRNIASDNRIVTDGMPLVAKEKAAQLNRYKLKAGDVIFSRVGRVGSGSVIRKDQEGWLLSGQMLRVRLENENFDNIFLSYAISSEWFQRALKMQTVGATRDSINTAILSNLPMVCPTLNEQQKIVEILTTADRKIDLIDQEIQATERLKKGLMQTLLTKGIGHTKFKMTEIGELPEEWEIRSLSEVSERRREIVEPRDIKDERYVGLEDLASGGIKVLGFHKPESIRSSKFRFHKKDILYGKLRPYLDKVAVADFDGICSTDIIPVEPNNINSNFLVYLLHSQRFLDFAISTISGTNHPRTSWQYIRRFALQFPKEEEQQKIAEILTTADKKIELLRQKRVKAEKLKKGLMQVLLTGQVRVKIQSSKGDN